MVTMTAPLPQQPSSLPLGRRRPGTTSARWFATPFRVTVDPARLVSDH